jgi:ADP-heptose:LPS heptosyltransferase
MLTPDPDWPVVFFVNGLGDHLLALPALRALTFLFPKRLTLICAPGMDKLFFSRLLFRKVVECIIEDREERTFVSPAIAERIAECDLFLSLVPWHSSSMTTLLRTLRAARTVGFFPEFTSVLKRDYSKHAIDLAFDVPKHLAPWLEIDAFILPPILPETGHAAARRIFSSIPKEYRVLVVHPDTAPEKMWRAERFVEVLDGFLDSHEEYLAIIVGKAHQPLNQGRHGDRVILAFGLPLDVAFGVVARANLFLGVDSCMLHVADLFRVPGVGLFGPSACLEFGFRVGAHVHVNGVGSLGTITVANVLAALDQMAVVAETAYLRTLSLRP